VAGGVHDHKAFGFHGLGITDDVDQGGTASLGDGAQGFFVDGSQAAFLVAGGGIVIDLGPKDTGVPLPPFDALDKLFAHLAAYGPAREQMLGPINLRSFADDAGAALGDEQVGSDAESRVGGDAAVAVRAAAVGAQHYLVGGQTGSPDVVDAWQDVGHNLNASV